jgi:hypothetical protein
MAGDRLARLASILLRRGTFTFIVEPAIADLQHAQAAGASLLGPAIGVARAICAAVVIDAVRDLRTAAAGAAAAPDRTVAATLAAIVAASVLAPRVIYSDLWSVSATTQAVLLVLLLPSAVASGLIVSLVPLGRRVAQQGTVGIRVVPASVMLLTIVLFAYLDQGVVRANAAFRTFAINAAAEEQTTFSAQLRFEQHATGGARRRTLAAAASAGAFLMLGVALRRRGATTTVVAAVAAALVYELTQSSTLGSILREWVPAALSYAIAAAALTVSRVRPATPA